jgi:arylsulfatase A-like enzyme
VGELLAALDARGLLKNSIVIITADHGEEVREHGSFGHSMTVYQEVLRVPLIIHDPVLNAPGKRVTRMVSTVDIMPTLLDLAGIAPPAKIEGVSLVPFLKGRDLSPRPAFSEIKPFFNPLDYIKALEQGDFKVIENLPSKKIEFYDHRRDPGETENLAGKNLPEMPPMLEQLRTIHRSGRSFKPVTTDKAKSAKMLKSLGYTK